MRLTTITVAGRPWAPRYEIWVAANDARVRFLSVDLHAAPNP
ncbi:hypothetical protein [Methylobacterium sp. E-016]|nr:hypothetical protein [Methylobacterium sp. E-016]